MPFIGTPLDTRNTFQSLQGKRFNGDGSTTAFTLDVAPSSTLDIEVFVENVRQDPNSAYTLSGTTLTFTGAPPSGTNNIYVVHQAKSVGTIDVPNDSVTANSIVDDAVESEHLNNNIISGQTALAANPATDDEFLISDAGTIKRIDAQFFQNTPAFHAHKTSGQTIATGTSTLVTFEAEDFDTDSAFDLSNERFTPQVAGKYFLYASIRWDTGTDFDISYLSIAKNGNDVFTGGMGNVYYNFTKVAGVVEANGSTDYFTVKTQHNMGSNLNTQSGDYGNYFGGFKLIGA
jgi:hypothetical protein